jgi:hypothetical protein
MIITLQPNGLYRATFKDISITGYTAVQAIINTLSITNPELLTK